MENGENSVITFCLMQLPISSSGCTWNHIGGHT